jgi:hypothetical protein
MSEKKTPFEAWWDVEGFAYQAEVCAATRIDRASEMAAKAVAWRAWIASKEHSAEVTVNQLTEEAS